MWGTYIDEKCMIVIRSSVFMSCIVWTTLGQDLLILTWKGIYFQFKYRNWVDFVTNFSLLLYHFNAFNLIKKYIAGVQQQKELKMKHLWTKSLPVKYLVHWIAKNDAVTVLRYWQKKTGRRLVHHDNARSHSSTVAFSLV